MKTYRPYIILILIFAVFSTFYLINRYEQKINIDNATAMNTGWFFEGNEITLPTDLNIEKNTPYTISTTLSLDFEESQFLLIRTSLQDIIVRLDGVIIFEESYGESLDRPYASMWQTIEIPRESNGLTLEITLSSPYKNMSGQLNEIYYGTEASHYAQLVRTYGPRLIVTALIFTIGLIVMLIDLVAFKDQQRGYVYIGLFAILLSFWMLAESRMLQFFTGSPLLIGSLAYLALPLFPLPLITYLNKYVLRHYQKPLFILKIIFLVQFSAVVILYVTGVADFFQTVIATQAWITIGIATALTLLIIEVVKYKNNNALQFIKIFAIMSIFFIFELIGFLLGDYTNTSLYMSIGVAIMMVIMLVNYVRYIVSRIKISHEKELYEKLAFMDYVTQGQNRLAFERDLDGIFAIPGKTDKLRLVLFDLDDLKSINDAFGHIEGDKAIKQAFDIITETFTDYGECYRIGGDEFACLYMSVDKEIYQKKQLILDEKTKAFDDITPYHFGLSYGSSLVSQLDMRSIDLIHLADLDMYRHKKNRKQK